MLTEREEDVPVFRLERGRGGAREVARWAAPTHRWYKVLTQYLHFVCRRPTAEQYASASYPSCPGDPEVSHQLTDKYGRGVQ